MLSSSVRFPLLVAAFFSLALGAGAAMPAPEKLLPDDTLFMVTAPDFARLRAACQTLPEARLWNDPAMKPFRDKFLSNWRTQFAQPLERELGVRFADYLGLPQGQLTFAITRNGWPATRGQSPGLILLLDAGDKSAQLQTNLAALRKKWVAAGKSLDTKKIATVDFTVLRLTTNDLPETLAKLVPQTAALMPAAEAGPDKPARGEFVVGQFKSLLIAGNSTRAVEQVMVHLTGGSAPALGDLAAYDADRLALFRHALFYGWANMQSLLQILGRPQPGASDTPDPLAVLEPSALMKVTGFKSLRTLAFNFQNSNSGSSFEFFVGVPADGRQGIFKLFPSDPRDSGPPPCVPADAMAFDRYRVDGQKAWATLLNVIGQISPQGLNGLNFLLDTANMVARQTDAGFDIRKSLFGNLGDDFIVYERAPGGASAAQDPPSLLLVGSPHPREFAAALKTLFMLVSPEAATPKQREFLGRKIYSVTLPPLPFPVGASGAMPVAGRTLNYAASDGYVAMTTDASLLEDYLRSGASRQTTLRERSGFADAAARVGGTRTGWFAYQNEAAAMRVLFESLRHAAPTPPPKLPPGITPLQGPGRGIRDWMDFSLLPPFDKVAKYFYFTVFAGSEGMNGITFKWFAPTPPALRSSGATK